MTSCTLDFGRGSAAAGKSPDAFYSPRELIYIDPAGRRLSDYESVICGVQSALGDCGVPSWTAAADELGIRGEWMSSLDHPDWTQYRDPSALWQRTYVRQEAAIERAMVSLFASGSESGAYEEIDDHWAREIILPYLQGFSFVDWGVFLAFNRCVRLAPSDTLTMMFMFASVDRLRHLEAITAFCGELEDHAGGLEGRGRKAWLGDPVFQPMRAVIERLMATEDWAEIAVVSGLLLDPLLYDFVIQHFYRRLAPVNRDVITPLVAMVYERTRRRYRASIRGILEMALADMDRRGVPVPADANRRVVQGWIDVWCGDIIRAVDGFAPVYGLPIRQELDPHPEAARQLVIVDCEEPLLRFGLHLGQ